MKENAALKRDRLVVCEHCEKTITEIAALKRENRVLRQEFSLLGMSDGEIETLLTEEQDDA